MSSFRESARFFTLATWLGGLWSGAILVVALVLGYTTLTSGGPWTGLWGIIYVDAFGSLMLGLIAAVGLFATWYAAGYMKHEQRQGEVTPSQVLCFFGWFHLFHLSMVAAVVVENLGFLWVAIEATTLISTILVGFYSRKTSLEAAWKYVILCGVGIALAMLGILLFYSAGVRAGLSPAEALNWSRLVAAAERLDPASVRVAFALVLVGFGTKAGLVPMHSWLPDAHSQAPSPVSALLSGVLLNTALYGILRFHAVAVRALGGIGASGAAGWTGSFPNKALLIFGLLSLGVAAIFIVAQRDVKRLLAYSSIEHMGIICIGIGLGGRYGLYGAVLHMVGHSMVKPVLFMSAGNLGHRYHTYRMERIRGALRALPVTGGLLLAAALAITGAPPASLFLSEFSIIAAGFTNHMGWVSVFVLAAVAVAFAGMMRHIREMVFGEVPTGIEAGERFGWNTLPMLLPLVAAVVLGVWIPSALSDTIHQIVLILGGGA